MHLTTYERGATSLNCISTLLRKVFRTPSITKYICENIQFQRSTTCFCPPWNQLLLVKKVRELSNMDSSLLYREISDDWLATVGMKSKGNSISSVLLLASRRNEPIDSPRRETNDLRNIARTLCWEHRLLRTLVVAIWQYETRRETESVDEETKIKNCSKVLNSEYLNLNLASFFWECFAMTCFASDTVKAR